MKVGYFCQKNASKEAFITTSDFKDTAIEYVQNVSSKVILINGRKLAAYMIEFNVGVETTQTYPMKSINKDYFSDG